MVSGAGDSTPWTSPGPAHPAASTRAAEKPVRQGRRAPPKRATAQAAPSQGAVEPRSTVCPAYGAGAPGTDPAAGRAGPCQDQTSGFPGGPLLCRRCAQRRLTAAGGRGSRRLRAARPRCGPVGTPERTRPNGLEPGTGYGTARPGPGAAGPVSSAAGTGSCTIPRCTPGPAYVGPGCTTAGWITATIEGTAQAPVAESAVVATDAVATFRPACGGGDQRALGGTEAERPLGAEWGAAGVGAAEKLGPPGTRWGWHRGSREQPHPAPVETSALRDAHAASYLPGCD